MGLLLVGVGGRLVELFGYMGAEILFVVGN